MSSITLESDDAVAVLDTAGGRLAQLTVRGHDLLVPDTGRRTLAGCYPMVPWAGRLDRGRFDFDGEVVEVPVTAPPHAMHGVGTDVEWDRTDDGAMRLDLADRWPLGGTAQVRYRLAPGSLTCTVGVTAGERAMPAVVGFHPCFVRDLDGCPDQLRFDAEHMWIRGDDYLPTGETVAPPPPGPWDDCFGGISTSPRISWGDVVALELRAPTSVWVIFDQLDVAVCAEPQSDIPNAFNVSGGTRLEPGETLELPFELSWV